MNGILIESETGHIIWNLHVFVQKPSISDISNLRLEEDSTHMLNPWCPIFSQSPANLRFSASHAGHLWPQKHCKRHSLVLESLQWSLWNEKGSLPTPSMWKMGSMSLQNKRNRYGIDCLCIVFHMSVSRNGISQQKIVISKEQRDHFVQGRHHSSKASLFGCSPLVIIATYAPAEGQKSPQRLPWAGAGTVEPRESWQGSNIQRWRPPASAWCVPKRPDIDIVTEICWGCWTLTAESSGAS